MENQELFDKYICGELSPAEEEDFEDKLKSDKEFAYEFKVFLLVVQGIHKEETQDCADFGVAMKKITREQLQEIIGEKTIPKVTKFSPWLWSSISAVAVIAIVITISVNLITKLGNEYDGNSSFLKVDEIEELKIAAQNAQYIAYEIIAENNYSYGVTRGGEESSEELIDDISTIEDKELKEKLPIFITTYQQAQDTQEIQIGGLNLAMIYLRLHNKDKALEILNELNKKYSVSDSEFDKDFAQKCQNIIKQIEKI